MPDPSHKERMLAGELYLADDPELAAEARHAARLSERFNAVPADDREGRRAILTELLGGLGEDTEIRPPLRIEYGYNITIGPRSFFNYGANLLDVAKITIGADAQIGPNVQLLTPTHPLDAKLRREKWEAGEPITLGDNVWLGGGVIVCPGVTIGDNVVVGAGAVVSRDLPPNTLAVGNPARVIREL